MNYKGWGERYGQLFKRATTAIDWTIQLPETIVHEYFSETTLQKLTVFKETKTWQFQLHNPKPFPCEVIEVFSLKLREAFQHIAEVNFMVTTEQSELEEKEIINYWNLFISSIDDLFPAYKILSILNNHSWKAMLFFFVHEIRWKPVQSKRNSRHCLNLFASNMA